MGTHDILLALGTSGVGRGDTEVVIAVAALVVVAVLVVLGLVLAVSRRGGALLAFGVGAVTFFGAVMVLSFV